jgi:hypothetical protein
MATDDRMDMPGGRGRAAGGHGDRTGHAPAIVAATMRAAAFDELERIVRLNNLIYWAMYGETRACARSVTL